MAFFVFVIVNVKMKVFVFVNVIFPSPPGLCPLGNQVIHDPAKLLGKGETLLPLPLAAPKLSHRFAHIVRHGGHPKCHLRMNTAMRPAA